MNLQSPLRRGLAAAAAALALAAPAAHAHRPFLLPSATVFSGDDAMVTVDAAISTDVFYFENFPMRLEGLSITAPDGSQIKPENESTGKLRSTFDVKLSQKGTYKLAVLNDNLNASWKVGNEMKRARGTAESLAKEIPADAQDLSVGRMQQRLETFVTSGKPSTTVFKPTGNGLELVPVTHPNDVVSGEPATFTLLLDGKPAADVPVAVLRGNTRYRDDVKEIRLKTDKDGKFTVKWPEAGMYWINASAGNMQRGVRGGTLQAPLRRASYAATFEVLPGN